LLLLLLLLLWTVRRLLRLQWLLHQRRPAAQRDAPLLLDLGRAVVPRRH